MQFRAKQIAPPKEWGTFEDLCHALFKQVWDDKLAQKNGRRGQAQHGVDIYGTLGGNGGEYFGVQCKGKDRNYGGKPTWTEIEAEVAKAEKFAPSLSRWIFVTTAASDAALQKAARELSSSRQKNGLFTVEVLGWEEVQALMADKPEVIKDFYPEHADQISEVMEALRSLPSLEKSVLTLIGKLDARPDLTNPHGSAVWETVTFDGSRGLGPALLGYPLGPSDAASCPRLAEVDAVLRQLDIAYSVRLVGEPGTGKSICSYQVAKDLSSKGFEVLRLLDPQADNVAFESPLPGKRRLYLIDDAHILNPQSLARMEERAGPNCLVLSTHNAIEPVGPRGAITLDAKRAVKTIAAALRGSIPQTLKAVRRADDHVGEHMMDSDLNERLDHAESASDRPWQFCFVLGGGWRRSKQAADSARAAGADLVLAAVAMRQLISRDARSVPDEITEISEKAGIDSETVHQGLEWLVTQRLVIGKSDCRTPHQRFAAVVLNSILAGQDNAGREKIGQMVEGVVCDPRFPFAGLRVLTHELRFGIGEHHWTNLLGQSAIDTVVARCWTAEGSDRGFAALALLELWNFASGGATAVIGPHSTTLGMWISNPRDNAFGYGRILNVLFQKDETVAKNVLAAADPIAIADAYSNANPDTAYGLAEFLSSIARIGAAEFNTKLRHALDRKKLRKLPRDPAFLQKIYTFSEFCRSVLWWDEDLALEMADQFIPTAQQALAKDPIETFAQLRDNFASTVLRVLDVLNVYVGKWKPTPRRWAIARRLFENITPERIAEQIITLRPRDFQSAAYLLHFLHRVAPRKYVSILRRLDWEKLGSLIGNDLASPHHETEVLLSMLSLTPETRLQVQKIISSRADQIVQFPPRLMLLAPEVGIAHVSRGGMLQLAKHGHVDWTFGGITLAIIAETDRGWLEAIVTPYVDAIARAVSNYSNDFTGPADGFLEVVIECAPAAWHKILINLGPAAEKNLAKCLSMDADHRSAAAAVVESAVALDGSVGDMARRLRKRFPKASIPTGKVRFSSRKKRSHRKGKGKIRRRTPRKA